AHRRGQRIPELLRGSPGRVPAPPRGPRTVRRRLPGRRREGLSRLEEVGRQESAQERPRGTRAGPEPLTAPGRRGRRTEEWLPGGSRGGSAGLRRPSPRSPEDLSCPAPPRIRPWCPPGGEPRPCRWRERKRLCRRRPV